MKEVRPTAGKTLLALMSILGPLHGRSFLDLFAGTGRVGIEALSRGAEPVCFVETLKARAKQIEAAVPQRFRDKSTVLALELRRGIAWLEKREMSFDVIFADPPYNEGWQAAQILEQHDKLLRPNGVFVYEHASGEKPVSDIWIVSDTRKYGESCLTFFVRRNEN